MNRTRGLLRASLAMMVCLGALVGLPEVSGAGQQKSCKQCTADYNASLHRCELIPNPKTGSQETCKERARGRRDACMEHCSSATTAPPPSTGSTGRKSCEQCNSDYEQSLRRCEKIPNAKTGSQEGCKTRASTRLQSCMKSCKGRERS